VTKLLTKATILLLQFDEASGNATLVVFDGRSKIGKQPCRLATRITAGKQHGP
jgi:hypothetical protein